MFQFPLHRDPRCNAHRLVYMGTSPTFQFPLHRDPRCNQDGQNSPARQVCFSSLYIGILAATLFSVSPHSSQTEFQFPLHRDPRCNRSPAPCLGRLPWFQFPLHRDPRCNKGRPRLGVHGRSFSSLYIGILAATRRSLQRRWRGGMFQFPLHRDPRCNDNPSLCSCHSHGVSVPFTSGSSLQPSGRWSE